MVNLHDLIVEYGQLATAITAIIGLIILLYTKIIRPKIIHPINSRLDKIDNLDSKIDNMDKKLSSADMRSYTLNYCMGIIEFKMDKDGHITKINDVATKISGHPEDSFIGLNWMDVLHPINKNEILSEWKNNLIYKRTFMGKVVFVGSKKEDIVIDLIVRPVFNSSNEFIEYIGMGVPRKTKNPA
jgi:PAS domain-containing protein